MHQRSTRGQDHQRTQLPDVFKGEAVPYSNDSKMRLLGVSSGTLKAHGAVSRECAEEMSAEAAEDFNADVGLTVTGIAKPW